VKEKKMAKLNLLSPWATFYNELKAFFEKDDEVTVVYNEDENIVNLYVDNPEKAAALTELLPVEKKFGSVTLQIKVIPANADTKRFTVIRTSLAGNEPEMIDLYGMALRGNHNFDGITTVHGIFSNPITYVIFTKRVIQYYNDSLGDVNGVCSTLMQNIANDIFEKKDGVYFCTSTSEGTNNSFRF
jgi:hypothetical protein